MAKANVRKVEQVILVMSGDEARSLHVSLNSLRPGLPATLHIMEQLKVALGKLGS